MSGSLVTLASGEVAMRVVGYGAPSAEHAADQPAAGSVAPATATQTSINSATTAGGIALLASNANRKGATITNTDPNALYVYFGATGSVSATAFNVKLLADETLVIANGGYTGAICGIWGADGAGAAKVCEFT